MSNITWYKISARSEAGDLLDEFLDDYYPAVSRDQAIALLERATAMLMGDAHESVA